VAARAILITASLGGGVTIAAMPAVLAAKVWSYWISFALIGGIVLSILALAVLYLVKVYATRFPKQ